MATQLQTEQGIVRVPTGTWHVDPAHSSVEFQVKHMMIATVRGRFKEFEGTIEAAENIDDSRAYGVVKTASIDTGGFLVGEEVEILVDISAVKES